ncbi:ADAMTS-like protein 4 [Ambystoma mexicanum]|uniref:ADAMTS-like protein 4 n=1 Tax=Ambystoma mexicanum TaxID=8296 RepID=UPI0037E7E23E
MAATHDRKIGSSDNMAAAQDLNEGCGDQRRVVQKRTTSCKDNMVITQHWRKRFLLVGLYLALSTLLVCDAQEQASLRKSRQALEDEGTGSKVAGVWSVWGPWSPCSQTCGLGIVERSRSCLAPGAENPSVEVHPQGVLTNSRPPFFEDRVKLMPSGAGRPSYPLHTDGNSEVPALPLGRPFHRPTELHRQPSVNRYEPYHQNVHHQSFRAEGGLPLLKPEQRPSRRASALYEREADFRRNFAQQLGPDMSTNREGQRHEGTPNRRMFSSHRVTNREPQLGAVRRNTSHTEILPLLLSPSKDSFSLFRPEHGELREITGTSDDAAHHHGPALPASPTKEPHSARRSRVQAFIKPGKYGYGKVPFALSLHKQAEAALRLRRQQKRRAPHRGSTLLEEESLEAPATEKPIGQPISVSAYGQNRGKSEGEPPTKGVQEDSPIFRVKTEEGLPPNSPGSSRLKDGVPTGFQMPETRPPHHQPVQWSVEEITEHSIGRGDRAKRQSKELESSEINKSRHPSEDSSEEGGQDLAIEMKSREQIDQLHEFLDAAQTEQPGALRKSGDYPSKESFDGPGPPRTTGRPTHTSAPADAVGKEGASLIFTNGSWISDNAPPNHWTEVSNEETREGVLASKEAIITSTITSREESVINSKIHKNILSNAKLANTSVAEKPAQDGTAASHELEYQDTPLSQEEQGDMKKQSPSVGKQSSQKQLTGSLGKARTTRRPAEYKPLSSRHSSQLQHHHAPPMHQYSRSAVHPSTFGQTRQVVRPRHQRQQEYLPGGFGASPPHSLFRDPPPVQRPVESDVWLVRGGNSGLPQARGQGPSHILPENNELQHWNLYHPGTESFQCDGVQKQYKACSQEPCATGSADSRAVQCATFDSQEFMGRLYQWEPFTEVQGYQRCELNCRPIGYRFYVRHTEKVQDGTPCEAASAEICVAGQCLRPGCDGILGSNKTLDACGKCGGDGQACKLVVGVFNDSNVPIGYHKILEIPKGATKINVTEMTRSPNYLALRSRSGKSVINGNWAVDPPGTYTAGGTEFIYSRPGREENLGGESFAADGPTTEALDVYMIFQQDNPGVSFHFFVSSPDARPENPPIPAAPLPPRGSGALSRASWSNQRTPPTIPTQPTPGGRNVAVVVQGSQTGRPLGTLQRNVRVPPIPSPPIHRRGEPSEFFWRRVGFTECSVTCGKGFWRPVFRCVSRSSDEEAYEEDCDAASRPAPLPEACSTQPCPAFWDVGDWSACSKSCGPGMQHRQVLCRQMYANRTTMVHPQRCSQLEKPNVTQSCQLRVCSHWEISTNWTSCSVMCGLGQRTRYVRCISNHGDLLGEGDCSTRLRPKTSEACDMGPCVRSWFHDDWSRTCSAECGPGIQRRSVVCLSSEAAGESDQVCTGSKPAEMRACNGGPCTRVMLWYTGPWSTCSAECDGGTQRRDVICVSKLGSEFNVTDPSECGSVEKPSSLQPCNPGACGARWYTTPWSACSRSCLGGLQVREVRCLTENRTFSRNCDPEDKPMEKRTCNTQMCALQLGENCKDKHQNCPLVVQARLCVYSYYKVGCCASCTRALERTPTPPSQ